MKLDGLTVITIISVGIFGCVAAFALSSVVPNRSHHYVPVNMQTPPDLIQK
jgi:hypothetical protein